MRWCVGSCLPLFVLVSVLVLVFVFVFTSTVTATYIYTHTHTTSTYVRRGLNVSVFYTIGDVMRPSNRIRWSQKYCPMWRFRIHAVI